MRWASGCGTDALYICLDLNGVNVNYAEFVAKSGLTSPSEPIDLARLWQMARECGAHAQAIRVVNGPDVLRKIMQDVSVRTAIVHLRAVERNGKREGEHFSAVFLSTNGLRIVGRDSYEREVAQDWTARWSGAALLVSAEPILLSGPEGAPSPQVYISPSKYDCGRVYSGTKVPYEFRVENHGDGDLEIADVRAGCACSTPTTGEKLIQPKQGTTLTGYVEAGSSSGRRTVQITVFANDPERPQVQVEVTLDVVPLPVRLSDANVVMSAKRRDEHPKARLAVEYTDPNAAVRVARLESSADWLTAELSADADEVQLSAAPLGKANTRSATLKVYTSNPEAMIPVAVEVRLVQAIECRPAQIYLDRKNEPDNVVRRIIELRPQTDVVLTNVKADIRGVGGVVKGIRHIEEKGLWELEVEFDLASSPPGMSVGAIELSGLVPGDSDPIEIPVYVR
jgi:hypothetical protein